MLPSCSVPLTRTFSPWDAEAMKLWVAKLKTLGIGAIAVLFVIVGIRQCFYGDFRVSLDL